jgi:DNA-binding protein Fis
MKLFDERPLSLHEFKERVHQLLVQKSSKHKIAEVTKFDVAYNVSDPDIAHAVRLGKKALKDPQIMAMLWNKFKNQAQIATLLGVNRSTVNRRCHEYNLI